MSIAILRPVCVALLVGTVSRGAMAAELKLETIDAWSAYVQTTEARIGRELRADAGFLALNFRPRPESVRERWELSAGKVVVSAMRSRDQSGNVIDVPSGAIHHWRGSVLIPGVTLDEVLTSVKRAYSQGGHQEDVLESRVLSRSRDEDAMRVFLKLSRTNIVTVVYNTEHDVRYERLDGVRASSTSRAVRIAEVADAGSPTEYERPEGRDHGFLWRLNSYWRYEQTSDGVIVECESVSLSRGVPLAARLVVGRLIDGVARESMERTLRGIRSRVLKYSSRSRGAQTR